MPLCTLKTHHMPINHRQEGLAYIIICDLLILKSSKTNLKWRQVIFIRKTRYVKNQGQLILISFCNFLFLPTLHDTTVKFIYCMWFIQHQNTSHFIKFNNAFTILQVTKIISDIFTRNTIYRVFALIICTYFVQK